MCLLLLLMAWLHAAGAADIGDVFLLPDRDIIRSSLSVREGLEIVVSVGMAVPGRIVARPPSLKL